MKIEAYVWLLEIAGPLYLHPARGNGVCSFTKSAFDAQRFSSRAAAEAERDALNGALGAQPAEHMFYDS